MRLIDADELNEVLNWTRFKPPYSKRQVRRFIETARTVEAEPKWIPVAERLPKFYEHVLVSKKKEEGFEPISVGCFYKNTYNDDIMFDDFLGTCCRYVSTDVLAWMPMPKPYEVKK